MPSPSKRERGLRAPRKRSGVGYLLLILLLLIGLGGLYVVVQARDTLSAISGIVKTAAPITQKFGTLLPTPNPLTEPINILLIGVDRREGEECIRNDVNIVVHIDPVRRSASMLSIPRDARVHIPDYRYDKINASYCAGEENFKDQGGGPMLVKSTVEEFLNMPIHYYAEVDFSGFERVIDLAGGVTIDVPTPLLDNEYPTENYGFTRVYIPAGLQHMDGKTALEYARSRHTDSDIGRNQRQQQVLLALRQRALSRQTLLDMNRTNAIMQELGQSLQTDIPVPTILSLAQLVDKIDAARISSYALDWNVCSEISGSTDLQCAPNLVWDMARQMQVDPTLKKLQQEAATIAIVNDTTSCTGCAGKTANFLLGQGYTIGDVLQNDPAGTYTRTLILDAGDHPFTREQLAEQLGLKPDAVQVGPVDFQGADIILVIGPDFEPPQ